MRGLPKLLKRQNVGRLVHKRPLRAPDTAVDRLDAAAHGAAAYAAVRGLYVSGDVTCDLDAAVGGRNPLLDVALHGDGVVLVNF